MQVHLPRRHLILAVLIGLIFALSGGINSDSPAADSPQFLEIILHGGLLSVDLNNVDAQRVFSELARETGLIIKNAELIPLRKITLKFTNLDKEAGIKKILQAGEISNYVISYSLGKGPGQYLLKGVAFTRAHNNLSLSPARPMVRPTPP